MIIIPVAQHKEGVLEANEAVMNRLKAAGVRVKMDASDQSAGWKFAEYEMKGVPLRLELGPKDMEKNQCVLARRDNGEKSFVSLDDIEQTVLTMLDAVQQGLYDKAKRNLDEEHLCLLHGGGGQRAHVHPGRLCQDHVVRRRGLRAEDEGAGAAYPPAASPWSRSTWVTCPVCGKPAKHMVYWGVAY